MGLGSLTERALESRVSGGELEGIYSWWELTSVLGTWLVHGDQENVAR